MIGTMFTSCASYKTPYFMCTSHRARLAVLFFTYAKNIELIKIFRKINQVQMEIIGHCLYIKMKHICCVSGRKVCVQVSTLIWYVCTKDTKEWCVHSTSAGVIIKGIQYYVFFLKNV